MLSRNDINNSLLLDQNANMPPKLSLQPGPPPNRGPQSIAEFIRRVNAEPGGFRALNQDELRKQIEKKRAGGDVEMADAEEADDGATKTNELLAAREELLLNINKAQKTAATTLDFISLLLSKEAPVQAAVTLNPELRNMVSIGTLGATAFSAPTALTQSRVPDNKMVAIGMRLQAVTKAADSLESAARRLEQEINLETAYWNEVRAASERGWSVFRHPDEPHTMGVKFGFSNAAPDFKASSIAPLRRAEDGSVFLEHGRMTGVSKRLQVTITQDGKIVGQSRLPRPLEDDVKEARDTIFAQELWHELNREGRNLLAQNVCLRKDAVVYTEEEANRTIFFRLVTLDDDENTSESESRPRDAEAERINSTLHLLLINAHRQNERRRTEQSTPGANKGVTPPYELLFPITINRRHEKTVQRCIEFLCALCQILRRAGINAAFNMTEPPIAGDSTESLASSLFQPSDVEFDLTLTPAAALRIIAKSFPEYETRFQVFLLQPAGSKAENPLRSAYPPPSYPDPAKIASALNDNLYDSTKQLFDHVCHAVPRALARHFKDIVSPPNNQSDNGAKPSPKWVVGAFNRSLVDINSEYGIHLSCEFSEEGGKPVPELCATADFINGSKKSHEEWTWRPQDEDEVKPLEDVMKYVLGKHELGIDTHV